MLRFAGGGRTAVVPSPNLLHLWRDGSAGWLAYFAMAGELLPRGVPGGGIDGASSPASRICDTCFRAACDGSCGGRRRRSSTESFSPGRHYPNISPVLPRPSSRLLLWFALIVVPFATVGPLVPGALPVAAAAVGAFALIVVFDAVQAGRGLRGVRLVLPALVRLQKDRAGRVEVVIRRERSPRQLFRIGLVVGESILPEEEEHTVSVAAGLTDAKLEWRCTPRARGKFFIREAVAEVASPLGFWLGRMRQEAACELRVYPNLFAERKQVAALFLRRGRAGAHTQRQAGQGREFEKLRNYVFGDPFGDIHWKASAKRLDPVSKVYQVERSHEVYVIIDASRLSARPLPAPSKAGAGNAPAGTALERYVTAALVLALAAEQQGDQFGLITFSDRVLKSVRAGSGQAHFDICRDALYTLEAQTVSPDFAELGTFIRLHLRKRALLVVLTALDDPVLAESFTKTAELISRQHLVLVNMLRTGSLRPLFSDEAEVSATGDIYQELGGHLQWQKIRELQKILRRRGVRLSLLDPARLSADLVAQHSEVRARQLV